MLIEDECCAGAPEWHRHGEEQVGWVAGVYDVERGATAKSTRQTSDASEGGRVLAKVREAAALAVATGKR